MKSEASSICTSRNRICSSRGIWLSSRCSLSFLEYSSSVPLRRRWATRCISPLGSLLDKSPGLLVDVYPLLPELGRALDAGNQGDSDDRPDKEQRNGDAVGTFVDVGGQRVEEDDSYYSEEDRAQRAPAAPGSQRDGEARRGHHRQNARRVGPRLRAHVGCEDDRDNHGDGRVDEYQRPDGPAPLRRHPVAG